MSLVLVQFDMSRLSLVFETFPFLLNKKLRLFRFLVFRVPVFPNRNEETFTVKLCR